MISNGCFQILRGMYYQVTSQQVSIIDRPNMQFCMLTNHICIFNIMVPQCDGISAPFHNSSIASQPSSLCGRNWLLVEGCLAYAMKGTIRRPIDIGIDIYSLWHTCQNDETWKRMNDRSLNLNNNVYRIMYRALNACCKQWYQWDFSTMPFLSDTHNVVLYW